MAKSKSAYKSTSSKAPASAKFTPFKAGKASKGGKKKGC